MITVRLNEPAIAEMLARRPGWRLLDDREAITRRFNFPTFLEAISFVQRIALVADVVDHHPEMTSSGTDVVIILATHDVDGLSAADDVLAGEIDKLAQRYFGPSY